LSLFCGLELGSVVSKRLEVRRMHRVQVLVLSYRTPGKICRDIHITTVESIERSKVTAISFVESDPWVKQRAGRRLKAFVQALSARPLGGKYFCRLLVLILDIKCFVTLTNTKALNFLPLTLFCFVLSHSPFLYRTLRWREKWPVL
jgi:hypothetical protein